jgi:hypothetical protein
MNQQMIMYAGEYLMRQILPRRMPSLQNISSERNFSYVDCIPWLSMGYPIANAREGHTGSGCGINITWISKQYNATDGGDRFYI